MTLRFTGRTLWPIGAALVILGLLVVNWRALAPYIKRAVDKQAKFLKKSPAMRGLTYSQAK